MLQLGVCWLCMRNCFCWKVAAPLKSPAIVEPVHIAYRVLDCDRRACAAPASNALTPAKRAVTRWSSRLHQTSVPRSKCRGESRFEATPSAPASHCDTTSALEEPTRCFNHGKRREAGLLTGFHHRCRPKRLSAAVPWLHACTFLVYTEDRAYVHEGRQPRCL